jgi:hypothetical protein
MVQSKLPPDDMEQRDVAVVKVPPGTPAWITADLIQQTLTVWQPYYKSSLSVEDAVTMILGVGQLFDVLMRGQRP